MLRSLLSAACCVGGLCCVFAISTSAQEAKSAASAPSKAAAAFDLKDGDRVAFIGATLIERDRHYGEFEAVLRSRVPGRSLQFRNMAWPGDTTTVQLRPLNFGSLETHITAQKPTVAIVCYGSNEAYEGPAGMKSFLDGYRSLLEMLKQKDIRIVLVSPNRHEDLGPPLPNPQAHNRNLELYAGEIEKLARDYGCAYVDLFHQLVPPRNGPVAYPLTDPLTENGIHLSDYGYWRGAHVVADQLGLAAEPREIRIDVSAQKADTRHAAVDALKASASAVQFRGTLATIPIPAPVEPGSRDATNPAFLRLKVAGLAPGEYGLSIDGKRVAEASAAQWSDGITIAGGPDFAQGKALRQSVVHKNLLFFHRWRAPNGEYIYGRRSQTSEGWRKDRDGGNAGNPSFPKEMAEFDRLIVAQEQKSDALAIPKPHQYELTPR